MTKRIALVGHCMPDSSFLTMTVKKAIPEAAVVRTNDETTLARELAAGVDLLLVNRALEPGFAEDNGVELLKRIKRDHPAANLMLITNYPEVQRQAVAAGAVRGFGKDDLGTPTAIAALRDALSMATK
jgi:DNA-binding NarL/FixJ family response regulator